MNTPSTTSQDAEASPATWLLPLPEKPDDAAGRMARNGLPRARYGRLTDVAAFLGATQGEKPPHVPRDPRLIAVGHAQECEQTEAGSGITAAFARTAQCPIITVALVGAPQRDTPEEKAATEPSRSVFAPRMSPEDLQEAFQRGRDATDRAVDSGADQLLVASLSRDYHEHSWAAAARLLGTDPVAIVGFSGIAEAEWISAVPRVRDLMYVGRIGAQNPLTMLRAMGADLLITLAGVIAQAAQRRTPVVLDTLETAVAALVAEQVAPGTRSWLLAGQLTPEPAHIKVLRALQLTPLFALNVPVGSGFGALSTLPLLAHAAELAGDTARTRPSAQSSR